MKSNPHNPVDAIKHQDDKRVMIPTTELAGEEVGALGQQADEATAYSTFRHEFERGRDPELYWLNKYANDSDDTAMPELKVDVRSLYVHEDIRPEMLINRLYRLKEECTQPSQTCLFEPSEMGNGMMDDELKRVADYYSHQKKWKNRLIQGDSLLVMNSLLKREGMAGKVQCVYIDPPYGIKYGSNWQMKLNSTTVADGKDEALSGEPEMIKAFRDTWELGIHSYLTYLRDRFVMARELLNDTGSIFVQISDENVHLVRNLLDEVFGSENFFSFITFKKTTGLGASGLIGISDYIVWYAKNKDEMKFRTLNVPKSAEALSAYSIVEEPNGQRRPITKEEKEDIKKLPKGARLARYDALVSSGYTESCYFDIVLDGKTYKPGKHSWKTNKQGVERLIALNRMSSQQGAPGYVRYLSDFPVQKLNNMWQDTSAEMKSVYVCQTGLLPIQRCMLMCTDPGDLVLDPTCGSGTTAYVAEQWGRRWITIDTSRIALNIAKKRLISATYPYYKLFDKENNNIRLGFEYKTVPHITLGSLAQGEESKPEILYDQPLVDKSRVRVSGPFTVETLQSHSVQSPDSVDSSPNEAEDNRLFQERIFAHLQTNGIRNGDRTQQAVFRNMEPVASPYLNARGIYRDGDGNDRVAYFMIGPKFGTVSKVAVSEAIREFRPKNNHEGASWLVLLGFSFEDNINESDYNFGNYIVSKVRMHDDLMQDGLLKKDRKAGSFITIGEPDIRLVKDSDTLCHVEICGLDIYDPIRDDVKSRSVEDIAYWEIDDNYDGTQFIVRGIHFCGGDKNEFDRWRKELGTLANSMNKTKQNAERTLKMEFADELWDQLYGFASEPLPYETGRKVAVRVISQFGEESSKVLTIGN